MAQRYWKLEKSGELGTAEVAAVIGGGGHIVLRTDVAKGKTTIYFAGESEEGTRRPSAPTRSRSNRLTSPSSDGPTLANIQSLIVAPAGPRNG
jgi:hypothetical protein